MSKTTQFSRKIIDTQNKENINYYPNNYSNKKSIQNSKYTKQATNQSSSLNDYYNNQMIANHLYNTKENTINNYHKNNNSLNNNDNNKDDKHITISDIIGEKCSINLDILRIFYNNYDQSKTSKKKMGVVKSYGVNTYQGIVRNYNEDRVSIIINMNKPKNYHKKTWPKISFFGIYDGHGGEGCAEYLRDNLHKLICINNEFFPDNVPEAIKLGFQKAEKDFINNYSLNDKKEIIDRSGSCAVIVLIVDKKIYIANVGDSRCILSMENGKKYIEVTKDHKPNSLTEVKRIKKYGGDIYQSETVISNNNNPDVNGKILVGPYRVLPGKLSVSRTVGDVEAKLEKFGGNPNVIIAEPEIFFYDLNKNDIDFFILGCDGIFDQISSNEILDCAWMILNERDHPIVKQIKDIHNQSGVIVDFIIKSALSRRSFDNVTCLFIALKELGLQFMDQIENTDKKDNTNLKYMKDNKTNYNNSSLSSIPLATEVKDKSNYERISKITRKTESLSNSQYDNESKNNNNTRNNNNFYLSNYRASNSNKKYPSFYTDYKIRNVKLNNAITNNNNDNYLNENNNNINNKNYTNIKLSHSRIQTNPINSSKNAQSYTKINNYSTDKNNYINRNNIGRYIIKSNTNSYDNNSTYLRSNITPSKRVSEGNLLNKRSFHADKVKEEQPSSYINNNISYEFKPLSRYNYNREIKVNDNKSVRKTLSSENNNSIVLNNANNLNNSHYNLNKNVNNNYPNTTSNKYSISTQKEKNNNNYSSIRKNYKNLNQQYKNQGQVISFTNNNNTKIIHNTYSSISTQNAYNQKNLSFNNNNDNANNNSGLTPNKKTYMSSRYKRSSTKVTKEEPSQTSNSRLNQPIATGIGRVANYNNQNNNYSEQSKKSLLYKEADKNYQSYTHTRSFNKNNTSKYSKYTITDIKNPKKDYESINSNKNTNYTYESEGRRYNVQLQRKVGDSYITNSNENNYSIYRNRRAYNSGHSQANDNNTGDNKNVRSRYYIRRY